MHIHVHRAIANRHYADVIMGTMASLITSLKSVYSTVHPGADQRKHQNSGLCAGNSPETGEFPAQKASNAEIVSIWWRHHGYARDKKKYIPTNGNLIFMAYLIAPLVTRQFPLIQFMTSESTSSRMSNYGIHQTYFMNHTSLFLSYFRTRYIYFASYCQWRLILPVWHKKPYERIACVALGGKKACQWDSVTWVV